MSNRWPGDVYQVTYQMSKPQLIAEELELEEWNGRIGNHYFQISQVTIGISDDFCDDLQDWIL